MPTIINPYKGGTGMGDDLFGIGGLADAFFGPKSTQSAYTREKFREAQRQNENLPLLADAITRGDQNAIVRHGLLSGTPAGQSYDYNLGRTAGTIIDPLDPRVLQSQTQAKVPYSSTATGYTAGLASQAATEANKTARLVELDRLKNERELIQVHAPVTIANPLGYASVTRAEFLANPGKYTQVAPSDIFKSAQAATEYPNWPDPNKKTYLGANVKPDNFFNWSYTDPNTGQRVGGTTQDGLTDVTTKKPLPAGHQLYAPAGAGAAAAATGTTPGAAEQKDRRAAINNADQVLNLGGKITEIVKRNPTVVGPVGNLRAMGQEGADLLSSLNLQFGGGQPGGYNAAVVQARAQLRQTLGPAAAQLIPDLFDKDINSVRTMNGMLVYKAAAALGQSGRDASDKDIKVVLGLTGDPSSWFQGPTTYMDKIGTLMEIIAQQRDDDYALLKPGASIQPRVVAPPPGGAGAGAGGAAVPPPPPGFVVNP